MVQQPVQPTLYRTNIIKFRDILKKGKKGPNPIQNINIIQIRGTKNGRHIYVVTDKSLGVGASELDDNDNVCKRKSRCLRIYVPLDEKEKLGRLLREMFHSQNYLFVAEEGERAVYYVALDAPMNYKDERVKSILEKLISSMFNPDNLNICCQLSIKENLYRHKNLRQFPVRFQHDPYAASVSSTYQHNPHAYVTDGASPNCFISDGQYWTVPPACPYYGYFLDNRGWCPHQCFGY